MISKLRGILDSVALDHAVIDVNGVGYLVFGSARTLGQMGTAGEPVTVLIETHVREDHIHLYGFIDEAEKDWFKILTGVQGVGAKVGLAILSVVPPEQLAVAIAAQDKAVLGQADGVGPKLATRIVTELKDKAGKLAMDAAVPEKTADTSGAAPKTGSMPSISGDAVSALINLGYGRSEAFSAVTTVSKKLDENADVSDLIRESLKELSA